jgi:putative hydrolase of the HAD superfamily
MPDTTTVLFDLDGTLCVPERGQDAVLADACERAGVDAFLTEAAVQAVIPELPPADDGREFLELCFAAVARREGRDPSVAPDLATAYEAVSDPSKVVLAPGASDALDAAAERCRVGLVTNGTEADQRAKLAALGIEPRFDAAVFAAPEEGIAPKPAAEPFERGLDLLDADPAETVYVGDSLHSDVGGAENAGIASVWIGSDDALEDHDPTHVIESIGALPAVL